MIRRETFCQIASYGMNCYQTTLLLEVAKTTIFKFLNKLLVAFVYHRSIQYFHYFVSTFNMDICCVHLLQQLQQLNVRANSTKQLKFAKCPENLGQYI